MATKQIDHYLPLNKDNLYHVYNRGNGTENIFYNHENYLNFLEQYTRNLSNMVDTFAYCLLPNHFHLLVRIRSDDPEEVSEQFRKFFVSYSTSINQQEKRKGDLLQRSFKRKRIDDERFLYAAVYYIHANPVHHRIVDDFTKYKYSSYNALIGNDITNLCKDEVFDWFGSQEKFIKYHLELHKNYFNEKYLIEDMH